MSFLNPFFLVGLSAIALPVLIHLLTRDRVQRVAFSTLRFFAKVSKKVLRRRKFQEMILLALRMLVCGLAAIAFARPFLKSAKDDAANLAKTGVARVIVVDASASMARPGIAQRLTSEAMDALKGISEDTDAVGLVTFDDCPTVAVRLGGRISEVRDAIKSITPGGGGTDLAAAISKANGMLKDSPAKEKEIVLISDLQNSGWTRSAVDCRIDKEVKLVPRVLEPAANAMNVAVVEASYPNGIVLDRQAMPIGARLANYSAVEASDLDVTLTVNDKAIATRKVSIRPGSTADVRFLHTFDVVGDNLGTIRVGPPEGLPGDSTPGDNVFYFNTRVMPQIKVLVLNGSPSSMWLLDAGILLKLAISPPGLETPFAVRVMPSDSAKAQDVADAQVVVLSNVGEVSPPVRDALKELLERGGGILLLPGNLPAGQGVKQPDTFNRVLGDVAPCKLLRIATPAVAVGVAAEANITDVDFHHQVFEEFARPDHGDLSVAKFWRHWEVTESQQATVPARFGGPEGPPAVLERQIGKGISMMLVSPADLGNWNDFPLRTLFAPYVHQTLRYLAVRSEAATVLQVGQALPVAPNRKVRYRSALKDARETTVESASPVAKEAGFYTQLSPDDKAEFVWAVNRRCGEADPMPMPTEKLLAAVQAGREQPDSPAELASMAGAGDDGKKDNSNIWWYVIAAVGVLLLAELFMGNRTLRH